MKRLVLVLACALAGCHVDAEVERIARTFPAVTIPGAHERAGLPMAYSRELKLDLGSSLPKLITGLELKRVVLTPLSGVPSLDFVLGLSLTASGDDALPDAVVARFDAGAPLGPDGEIDATVLPVELAPYVQAARPFEFEALLDAPADDWTLQIEIEASAASDGKITL